MALIKEVKGKNPFFGKNVFLAENSTIVGDVSLGDNCSVWFSTVLRGDVNYIKIGNKVNIQDGVVIHGTYQNSPVQIGSNVSIGHNAIVHGCTIKDNVLIGMGAIIMDGVIVNKNSIVAAGSVVLEGTNIESETIYAGVPAKRVKKLNKKQAKKLIENIANNYLIYSSWM